MDYATDSRADVLLELGDRIDDLDHETDVALAEALAPAFKRFPRERVQILGNHDVVNLTRVENEEIFGCSFESRVVDLGECRLIAWQPDVAFNYEKGSFPPTSGHLGWLTQALLDDERPAIIATHVSLAGRAQTGNFYHHYQPTYSTYPDHEAVRAAVEKTGRAAMWVAGHSHSITDGAVYDLPQDSSILRRFDHRRWKVHIGGARQRPILHTSALPEVQ